MTKRIKYICEECVSPCIIEVDIGDAIPFACPYAEIKNPEWELMEEGD